MHEICWDWKTLFILTGLYEIFTFILNTYIKKSKADGSQTLCVKIHSSYLRTSGYL